MLAASRATLSMIPCRLAYWPVRIEARFGEQIGVGWNARVNVAPSSCTGGRQRRTRRSAGRRSG
jgi:hypothetical protein